MEKMPFRESLAVVGSAAAVESHSTGFVSSDWTQRLPVLASPSVTLRELRMSDAASLLAMLSTEEVARFISPPPTTIEGFEQFIVWTHRERAAGRYVCFAVVPKGTSTAIGIFQVRQLDLSFDTAEWGFAIGWGYWGTGTFLAASHLVLNFAFEVMGIQRLEARAAVRNGRGNGALRKIGAVCEGMLRKSFLRDGEYLDQNLWSILAEDWKAIRTFAASPAIH